MNRPRVLVVVPAHNEEDSLPATLAEIRAKAPDVEVLVVDDGSRDATTRIARESGVRVLRHPVNLGVGGALQTGFRWAFMHGFDIVVLDVEKRELNVELTDEEIAGRMRGWTPPPPNYTTGVLAKYAALVHSASEGAITRPNL